jgi:Bacterial membrane protein YfhO
LRIGEAVPGATATSGDPRGLARRVRSATSTASRISPDTWGLLAIAAAVLVANSLYVFGVFDPNPLGPRSGLVSSVSPGAFGGFPTIDPNNGVLSQAVGHRAVLDWLHLSWPWWNPYEGTGTPLAGGMQSAALFPFTALTAFSNGQLWEHMLLELIAGISTFLLMRRLSVGVWASSAAGIAFALNGTFSWFSHATVNPVAFLPLLLLGLELAYSASIGKSRGGWWLIPIAGALLFYGGFPEVTFIDGLMAVMWFAWRCWTLRADTPAIRAFAVKTATGAVVTLLLIAPLLIPFVDYLHHAFTDVHDQSLTNLRIPHQGLPQVLLPYVYGPIFGFSDPGGVLNVIWARVGGFLSTSLLLFGLLGVFSPRRLALRVLLVAWVLAGLSHTYGQPPLIGHVFDVVPGMSKVEFFRYAPSSIELAVIILAGFGLDDLISRRVSRRRLAITTVVALGLVAVAALGAKPLVHQLGSTNTHSRFSKGSVLWGAGIIAAAFVFTLVRRPRIRAGLLVGVLALDVIALFVAAELSAPRNVKLDLAPVAYLRQHLGTSRYFTLGPAGVNYGSYFGIASLNSNDNPQPKRFADYTRQHLDQAVDPTHFIGTPGGRGPSDPSSAQELIDNIAGYRAAGVAYVLTPPGQPLPRAVGFTLVFKSPSAWIYRLSGSQRYFTAGGCRVTTQSRTDVGLMCPRATTLIRRETSMPGWSAHVDGHATTVRTVDGIFQGVAVDAGEHRVTFSFTPPGETFGLIAFLVGIVWLIAAAAGVRLPGRRANL